MWYKNIFLTFFTVSVLFTFVKASCLEYGHSCWGAHGKRSMDKLKLHETFSEQQFDNDEIDGPDKAIMDNLNAFITPYPRLLRFSNNEDIDDENVSNNDVQQQRNDKNLRDLSNRYWKGNTLDYAQRSKLMPANQLEYLGKSLLHKKFSRQLHKRLMQQETFNDNEHTMD